MVTRVGKINKPIRGTPYSPHKLLGHRLGGQNGSKVAFWTIFRKFLFSGKNAIKSGLYGLKPKIRCIFRYFFTQGCIGLCTGPQGLSICEYRGGGGTS